MAMANSVISLATLGSSIFPSSVDKLKKSSNSFQKNSFWVSRISSVKAVQSPVEPATGKWERQRRPQNVDGDIFVDHTCIDCDTCRWMAPQVFTRVDGMSAVSKQPTCKEDRLKALQALLSCPTGSIRTEEPPPDILDAQKTFPIPIDEKKLPGVYHCGYHSVKSYGASSYLIAHPEGNILIDSPRFTERLAREIETLGGVRYMFLTHKDDVADHGKWSERLGCDRILHSKDVEDCTIDVEIKLEGSGPWSLADDILLIHTPGHTEGSVCLFYKPLKVLFSGDHLMVTGSKLDILENFNRLPVDIQVESIEKLLGFEFNWIIPGHRRKIVFKDVAEKNEVLKALIQEHSSVRNRPLQCIFAAASIGVMVSAHGFFNSTAFCYLIASMGLQALWSFALACLDLHALRSKRNLQNPVLVSLFVVGDWVTAILSLAAACSSAGVIVLYARDLGYCRSAPIACSRFQTSISLAFISWFLLAISSHVTFWLLAAV
ncbi:Beta-lactamase-like protein [Corchorus olitorius]|uniref:CASP-like protein n=1 Tax=Corchorus olitorius TaxID=93759 RepID=A0A1R3I218_9ROSI|nr:Beta-lactamase-like protein [Corchorus olitorius]